MSRADLRFLAACGLLLGVGVGLLWAGGALDRALDDAHEIFGEDLPDSEAYDAPWWMRLA